jgi:hypothetical protein
VKVSPGGSTSLGETTFSNNALFHTLATPVKGTPVLYLPVSTFTHVKTVWPTALLIIVSTLT